ncbi:MAG TPA: IS110 family transposase [Methylococcaceae bacterium]|nr:IS110 family transposase [Methylococcaceae bacterium]
MTKQMLQSDDTKPGRLLVAMEMSLSKWGLAAAVAGQPRKRVKTVAEGDYGALLEAVAEFKARFKLLPDAPVIFCYEAGRDGFYPYRRLVEMGYTVWVIDSASIEVSRRRRNAKSDGIDADKLVELMQRKALGEQRALRIVRVPDGEVEDQRQLPREREVILMERRRVLNQIGSQLFTQGYREVPESSRGLKAWLMQPRAIGPYLRERLERDIERLALLEAQWRVIEKRLAEQVQQEQAHRIAGVAKALMQLSGIGLIGAWVLASELYGWREFRNRREVGAVLGLTPTPYSSGADQREQGISKAGNRRARSLLVELSWLWLRYQPESALSQWFMRRFSGGGKRLRRIGIVALARRLGVALWHYAAHGVVPEGAVLKAAKA